MGSKKPFAVDWLGRHTAQFRGSDIIGNGIQYEAPDDILMQVGLLPPYIARTQKLDVGASEVEVGYMDETVKMKQKRIRYMTDEEYANVSIALGDFHRNYFERNEKRLINEIKRNKGLTRKSLESVFRKSKDRAIKAVQSGIKEPKSIIQYINDNWDSGRGRETTESIYDEEE